ncbi:MAG: polysaccharide deacetylase family protein [Muribaculaceae bacterium]|nr:polysaccharide deacetylase family protein [Muribaculaceae bacterium]
MNILSFDVEEWYIVKHFLSADPKKYQAYDIMLERILDLLDEHQEKATFFCLGALVKEFPHVVKAIANRGHEVGCHSHIHGWINKMKPEEFRKDLMLAINDLEDATGKKVESFRAPAFSIGESNKWAFEILAECGIKNDASIFPAMRDFGGFPAFEGGSKPCRISYKGIEINEFPITLTKLPIVGKEIAYSGGGYFRLLPLSFVKSRMKDADYGMCYFHIVDLLDFKSKMMTKEEYESYFKEAGTLKNRMIRYMKSNLGRKRAFAGLSALLDTFDFCTVEEAASIMDLTIVKI